jgi:hypothetical protein
VDAQRQGFLAGAATARMPLEAIDPELEDIRAVCDDTG